MKTEQWKAANQRVKDLHAESRERSIASVNKAIEEQKDQNKSAFKTISAFDKEKQADMEGQLRLQESKHVQRVAVALRGQRLQMEYQHNVKRQALQRELTEVRRALPNMHRLQSSLNVAAKANAPSKTDMDSGKIQGGALKALKQLDKLQFPSPANTTTATSEASSLPQPQPNAMPPVSGSSRHLEARCMARLQQAEHALKVGHTAFCNSSFSWVIDSLCTPRVYAAEHQYSDA